MGRSDLFAGHAAIAGPRLELLQLVDRAIAQRHRVGLGERVPQSAEKLQQRRGRNGERRVADRNRVGHGRLAG